MEGATTEFRAGVEEDLEGLERGVLGCELEEGLGHGDYVDVEFICILTVR